MNKSNLINVNQKVIYLIYTAYFKQLLLLIMITLIIKRNFTIQKALHPYLLTNLKSRALYPLKPFQEEAFNTIQNKFNFFLNSCTGSGKTLAYLVPLINSILLQDAKIDEKQPKGSLILTLNKELVSQVHRQIKLLDPLDKLKAYKIGSLAQIQADSKVQDKQIDKKPNYFINSIEWNKIDILVSTPQSLMNFLTVYKSKKINLDPKFIVIDQADLLLQLDKNVRKNTDKIIQIIRKNSSDSSKILYQMVTSSFPKHYRGFQAEEKLKQNFKTLKLIQGQNKHKLPQKLDLFYIQIAETTEENINDQKIKYLIKILNDRKRQRIIIFCKQKAKIQMLYQYLQNKLGIKSSPFYAQLSTEQRQQTLIDFNDGKVNILISSQLGSRGLDFNIPIDCVIEYDMSENIIHFINRVGRASRNNLHGQVITFVEQKNKQFFKHLCSVKQANSQFDELFSRKRSYSKLYKQKNDN